MDWQRSSVWSAAAVVVQHRILGSDMRSQPPGSVFGALLQLNLEFTGNRYWRFAVECLAHDLLSSHASILYNHLKDELCLPHQVGWIIQGESLKIGIIYQVAYVFD